MSLDKCFDAVTRPAWLIAVLAMLSAGCGGNPLDCVLGVGPECRHSVTVDVDDIAPYSGLDMEIRIRSLDSGRTEFERHRITLSHGRIRTTFDDFVRAGSGGPYEVRVYIDVDDDGRCDDAPTDVIWRYELPRRDQDLYLRFHDGIPTASSCG